MLRPCTCDRFVKGEPLVRGRDCRACWLFHNDARYQRRWSDGEAGATAHTSVSAAASSLPGNPPCVHRGEPTGEVLLCASCNQSQSEHPVFHCKRHGECTLTKSFADKMCCRVCDDYTAKPPDDATGKENNVPHHWDLRGDSPTEWVEQLFEQSPGPWPPNWTNLANVQEAFRRLFDRAMNYCPPVPDRAAALRSVGLREALPGVWIGTKEQARAAFDGSGCKNADWPPGTPPRLCARFVALSTATDWFGHERYGLDERSNSVYLAWVVEKLLRLRRRCSGIVLYGDDDIRPQQLVDCLAVLERQSNDIPPLLQPHFYDMTGRLAALLAQPICDPASPWLYPRGIVIYGGGWRYFPGVYVTVRLLRHWGCTLPIQVWCMGGSDEFDIRMHQATQDFDVEWLDANDLWEKTPGMALRRERIDHGWMLKSIACLWSGFTEVIGLDADSHPAKNPEAFLDDPEYRRFGAALWPDQADFPPTLYQKFGVTPPGDAFSIESGQVVFDKSRHFQPLWLAGWLNTYWDYTYHCGPYGDKDLLQLAFLKYYQSGAVPPAQTTGGTPFLLVHRKPRWLRVAFLCRDVQGEVLFVHRCRDKFRLNGTLDGRVLRNRYATVQNTGQVEFVGDLPAESEAHHFYREIDQLLRPELHVRRRDGRAGEWDLAIWQSVMLQGEYEVPPGFRAGDVVIDIGGHIGAFTRLVLQRGVERVVAVEPEPGSAALFQTNINHSGKGDGVLLLRAACWRSDTHDPSWALPPHSLQPHTRNDNTGSFNVMGLGDNPTLGGPIAVVALDEILHKHPRVRLLKIDCEGSEFPILLSSNELSRVQEIIGEYHCVPHPAVEARIGEHTSYTPQVLQDFLQQQGFGVEVLPRDDWHGRFRAVRCS